ncbi:MAG: hypothetical protein AAF399_26130, partial [Bacteroidota bacterium]
MKLYLSLTIAFFAAFLSASQVQAQRTLAWNDTMMIFQVDLNLIIGDGIGMNQSEFGKAFLIRTPGQVTLVSGSVAKKLVLP